MKIKLMFLCSVVIVLAPLSGSDNHNVEGAGINCTHIGWTCNKVCVVLGRGNQWVEVTKRACELPILPPRDVMPIEGYCAVKYNFSGWDMDCTNWSGTTGGRTTEECTQI